MTGKYTEHMDKTSQESTTVRPSQINRRNVIYGPRRLGGIARQNEFVRRQIGFLIFNLRLQAFRPANQKSYLTPILSPSLSLCPYRRRRGHTHTHTHTHGFPEYFLMRDSKMHKLTSHVLHTSAVI